jgi:hypothetical protein
MKLVPMLVFLYAILIAIMIFDNVVGTGYSLDPYGGQLYANFTGNDTDRAFWQMFMNPTILSGNAIWLILTGLFVVGVGLTLTVVTKSDMFILYGFFIVMFMAGIVPIIALYNVIDREAWVIAYQAGSCACTDLSQPLTCASTCPVAIIFAAIICGPIAIYWLFLCLEWLTARMVS